MAFVVALHALCLILLSIYALHQGLLLILYLRSKRNVRRTSEGASHIDSPDKFSLREDGVRRDDKLLPTVTIQLPLFNERFMAERIICAVSEMDYPRDRLHIQVLDDSTDDTTAIAQRTVQCARALGVNIDLIHRANRTGFKAGALAAALPHAQGELIAIFDADFVPPRNFLRRLIIDRHVFDDPCVGFVQTRWDYLNRDSSALTRAQAMTLDVHFMIEQPARNKNGLLINFNGSGGIWRRACICDAGGWAADTLTEDLDLSYRAELRGWHGLYLEDESAPGELPSDVLAYKRQQARWARGTFQTVRKLMPCIARSSLTLSQKAAAWMHLSGYFIHPLIFVMTLTTPFMVLAGLTGTHPYYPLDVGVGVGVEGVWINAVSLLSFAPMLSMLIAHCARGRPVRWFLRDLPASLMLGVGVSFSNTIAMLNAVLSKRTGDFTRTPKAIGRLRAYRLQPDWTMWIELCLAIYIAIALILIVQAGLWFSVAPLMLYALGFGGVSLHQMLGALHDRPSRDS